MRLSGALLLIVFASCGDNAKAPRDAARDAARDDAPNDAPLYPACANAVHGTAVAFRLIGQVAATGAMLATSPPGDPRLFVVEQHGAIRLFKDEVLQPEPFLDLSAEAGGPVIGGNGLGEENGLLGLAFHPQYATNREFFVVYNSSNGDFYESIVRCRASDSNPDKADPVSCVPVMAFRHDFSNHEGGMAEFGSDGYLYVSTGDGGGGGDSSGHAQDPNSPLGKMLRIDVDNKAPGKEYGIPADNPYALGGGAPEVFMRGLRNPWRWSFDRATGDMWIGDVGQAMAEEIDVLRPSEQRGANLGWSVYEGDICCQSDPNNPAFHCMTAAAPPTCSAAGMTFPKISYDIVQDVREWQSIIGGQVYRGSCFPDLYGWYFYTDWERRELVKARIDGNGTYESFDVGVKTPAPPASLHSDYRGELYLTTTDGGVYRLEIPSP